jgi:hypothetical protein
MMSLRLAEFPVKQASPARQQQRLLQALLDLKQKRGSHLPPPHRVGHELCADVPLGYPIEQIADPEMAERMMT